MPLEWFEKDKAIIGKDQIVCDYGFSRNYVMASRDGFKTVYEKPSEPIEEIHKWTTERAQKELQAFWESDRKLIANLFERARIRVGAISDLAGKAEVLLDAIFRLAEEEGSATQSHAAHTLLWTLNKQVSKMNQLARAKPQLFSPIAKKFWKWPLLKSTHPHLSESDDLLNLLELGKEAGFQNDKYSKWKPDKAMEIAWQLKNYQHSIRVNYLDQYPVKAQKIFQALPFNQQNAPELWEIAKWSLLRSYPNPEMVKEFQEVGIRKSKRSNPSSRRQAILEKIHARFIHLACQS